MTTKIKEQYIYPPRPATAIPRDEAGYFGELGFQAQIKVNDARCLIKFLGDGKIELWSRHAERFKNYTPPDWLLAELTDIASKLQITEWTLLDGGLLDFKQEAIRDSLCIWDILVLNGEYLVGTTYQERYQRLHQITNGSWFYNPPHRKHEPVKFGLRITEHTFIPENWPYGTWNTLWELVEKVNAPYLAVGKGPVLEGMVLKQFTAELERAWKPDNNAGWNIRSRITTGRHTF